MRPIATDGVAWSVCVFVCRCVCVCGCVCWSRTLSLRKRPNRSRSVLGLTCVGPWNHVLIRVEIPTKRAILGLSGSIKSIVINCCVVRCKRTITYGTTAPLLQRIAMLPTGRCHITYIAHREKNPPRDAAFRQN